MSRVGDVVSENEGGRCVKQGWTDDGRNSGAPNFFENLASGGKAWRDWDEKNQDRAQ